MMRTLRDFFHMGSVEWVTFHDPDSHDSWGGVREDEGEVVGSEDGARRVAMVNDTADRRILDGDVAAWGWVAIDGWVVEMGKMDAWILEKNIVGM